MPAQASSLVLMIVFFAIFYFTLIRPQKKKDKQIQDMRNSIAVGDEIITIGGIHGKVVKVNSDVVVIELSHAKQRITFSKWAVGSVEKKSKDDKKAETEEVEKIETEEVVEDTKKDEK